MKAMPTTTLGIACGSSAIIRNRRCHEPAIGARTVSQAISIDSGTVKTAAATAMRAVFHSAGGTIGSS